MSIETKIAILISIPVAIICMVIHSKIRDARIHRDVDRLIKAMKDSCRD